MTNKLGGRKPPQTPAQRRQKRRDKLKAMGLAEHPVIVPNTAEAKAAINRVAADMVAGLSGQNIRLWKRQRTVGMPCCIP